MTKKRKRTNFSPAQKAEIYARDHATCAFSGLSLWIFDYGIRSNYQMDWADHIKPSARGGSSSLENGICASHTFNAKKNDNSSDNVFFFKNGYITPDFIHTFGVASDELLSDLNRRSNLVAADWYLNRAIVNIFIGHDWRWRVESKNKMHKRDDAYWFKSAAKNFKKWKKKKPEKSLLERGLIKANMPFGVDLLLQAELVETETQFQEWIEALWPAYRLSLKANDDFFAAPTHNEKSTLLA